MTGIFNCNIPREKRERERKGDKSLVLNMSWQTITNTSQAYHFKPVKVIEQYRNTRTDALNAPPRLAKA